MAMTVELWSASLSSEDASLNRQSSDASDGGGTNTDDDGDSMAIITVVTYGWEDLMPSEEDYIERVLYSKESIHGAVVDLGRRLAEDYSDKAPVLLCTLKGACLFAADLVRAISLCPKNTVLDFLTAGSYGSEQTSSGTVTVSQWCSTDLENRHVLLIDDICDTGHTLMKLIESLRPHCASIKTAVLLDKASRREVDVAPDYSCFTCPNLFVVGYGMDFDQRFRTLPFIGVLRESAVNEVKKTAVS